MDEWEISFPPKNIFRSNPESALSSQSVCPGSVFFDFSSRVSYFLIVSNSRSYI